MWREISPSGRRCSINRINSACQSSTLTAKSSSASTKPKINQVTRTMIGISEKTMAIHRDKLYAGYVKKLREIWDRLAPLRERIIAGESIGNATFSDLRAVKVEETFAANGVYLHEWYFGNISGDGDWSKAPELASAIAKKWGSIENGIKDISECAMAARGWAFLVWDHKQQKIMQYNADSHNQGGGVGLYPYYCFRRI